ncbi:uncharacterized protein MAM_02573 [Metarhizium album ARSEF 1941]|uniref:Uncharacterized protein n=1 Tax=Metarhizium album (strain ARSEF 1941) TaxID=1081103 RepID=A0A0B2X342_METAS|nr:uncharacterized protein MAM_02573 [Metarhizium album ARSEF 1941]KHN99720.1 hypothetical protein MAM_02573 [Metarhizium album ARSEF 1941]
MKRPSYVLCALSLACPLTAAIGQTCTVTSHGLSNDVDCQETADFSSPVVQVFHPGDRVEVVCKKSVDMGTWTALFYRTVDGCYFSYGNAADCDPDHIRACRR